MRLGIISKVIEEYYDFVRSHDSLTDCETETSTTSCESIDGDEEATFYDECEINPEGE